MSGSNNGTPISVVSAVSSEGGTFDTHDLANIPELEIQEMDKNRLIPLCLANSVCFVVGQTRKNVSERSFLLSAGRKLLHAIGEWNKRDVKLNAMRMREMRPKLPPLLLNKNVLTMKPPPPLLLKNSLMDEEEAEAAAAKERANEVVAPLAKEATAAEQQRQDAASLDRFMEEQAAANAAEEARYQEHLRLQEI
jgi:hypothetical protein